jgi:hypothetical protein
MYVQNSEKLIYTLELKIFQQGFESHLSKLTLLWDVTTIHRKHVNILFEIKKNYFSVLQTLR